MPISDDDFRKVERQVLVEILTNTGPLLGARLKPRLTAELGHRLGLPAHEWRATIPRLSHFLATHSDLVEVHRPVGPGDITIGLRSAAQSFQKAGIASSHIWYLPNIWAAFINPDPKRRRFFHRQSREVAHFLDASSAPPNPELAARVAGDRSFVEISFATADLQREWVGEFLETSPLIPSAQREIGGHFARLPFTSSINAALSAALGQNAEAWRRFRAQKIDDLIARWATANGIDLVQLKAVPTERSIADQAEPKSLQEPAFTKASVDIRSMMRGLAESMNDDELRSVLVPLSALERLFRSDA